MTIGLGYVGMAMQFGMAGIVIFFAGHIGADLAWYSGVSYLVSKGKEHINPRFYRGVILGCVVILAFFAVFLR